MPEEKTIETPKGDVKVKVDDKKVKFEKKVEVVEQKVEVLDSSIAETVKDPYCDENNPRVITFQDVCQAAFMIKGGVDLTPCKVRIHAKIICALMITNLKLFPAIAFVRNVRHGNLLEEGIPTIYGQL